MKNGIEALLARIGGHELRILLTVLAVAALLLGFVELAGEVLEGEVTAFDRSLLLLLRNPADLTDPIGPRWVENAARDLTALGSTINLSLLVLAVMGYLALTAKRAAAVMVLASVGGGMILSTLLKMGFDRPRPDLVPHGDIVYTASFPSGHAMLSAVAFLTLGALMARVQPRRRVKAYILLMAVLLTVLVGCSRVYLGVHWPTDVLAGWCVGAAWSASCWLMALWLQRRGVVEKEGTANGGEGDAGGQRSQGGGSRVPSA